MGVVFGVGLVFMIFDLDEVGGSRGGVEREGDEGVDCRGFDPAGKSPRLGYAVSMTICKFTARSRDAPARS